MTTTAPRTVIRERRPGPIPNLRFPFAMARTRRQPGGWIREVTQRELPVATQLAGVNMWLDPGAYREPHWHRQSEWAIVLDGGCRIGAVDHEGRNFLADVRRGDLWFFPKGVPHHVQGLDDGAEILLVLDDGAFSAEDTFLMSDFLAHTPPAVVARTLGWTAARPGYRPEPGRCLFPGRVPPPLGEDRVQSPTGEVPRTFTHRLLAQAPQRLPGGSVRIVDSANFAATTTSAALVELAPGALREPHWHPTGDEWQYYLAGRGRMGVFGGGTNVRTFDVAHGDVGYVPCAYGHYIENTGDTPLLFLELFRNPRFEDVSLAQWLANTPPAVTADTIRVPRSLVAAVPKEKRPVAPAGG
jgi:oxalate decarboxylase